MRKRREVTIDEASDLLAVDAKGTISTSKRGLQRLRQAAGAIADRVIHEARPSAPTLEIARVATERCLRAGLPIPSRASLVARIAYVRANGAPGECPHVHQITIDHCLLTDRDGNTATLSIAVLEPPGAIVAWRLSGRPADASTMAALIAEAHVRASGMEPARISALVGRNAGDMEVDAALRMAGIDRVGGSAARPLHGTTARRVLGRTIVGMAVRMRRPSIGRWADEIWIVQTAERIATEFVRQNHRKRPITPFRIVSPYHASGLMDALERIRRFDDTPG